MFTAVFHHGGRASPNVDETLLTTALQGAAGDRPVSHRTVPGGHLWTVDAAPGTPGRSSLAASWCTTATRTAREADSIIAALGSGPEAVRGLRKPFAAVTYTPETGVVAARDHLGLRPLYYAIVDAGLILTTTAATLHAIDGVAMTPSRRWLAMHLAGLSTMTESTPWTDVHQVRPGHILRWSGVQRQRPEQERFHRFDLGNEAVAAEDGPWVEAYRSALELAVERTCQSELPTAIEVSGGIDSSTILALVARQGDGRIDRMHALGYCTMRREAEMIGLANRFVGVRNEGLFDTRDLADDRSHAVRMIEALGHPPEHNQIYAHRALYAHAERQKLGLLVSGFGGDEAASSHASRALHELLPNHVRAARATLRPSLIDATRESWRFASAALDSRSAAGRLETVIRRQWSALKVSDSVADEFGLEALHRTRLEPLRRPTVNDQARARLTLPMLSKRASQTAVVVAAYGLDAQWPLLDVDLIEQWMRTPTSLKRRDGHGRYLHRCAIDDLLPTEVAWNPTKSMGERTHATSTDHEHKARRLAEDLLPALASMVDLPAFIAQASALDAAPTRAVTSEWVGHWHLSNALLLSNLWLDRFHARWAGR